MANDESTNGLTDRPRYVPVVSPEERVRRNQELRELFALWNEEDEDEAQKEAAALVREAKETRLAVSSQDHGQ
jgi:hypothetical protein